MWKTNTGKEGNMRKWAEGNEVGTKGEGKKENAWIKEGRQ